MPIAKAVIGAGYGDEGKGVMTDALVAPYGADATVLRYNGGAQAGHTVTLADGRRHVFHHVGSGAFAGAATFLSRFFVANPILLAQEIVELAALGVRPRIAIDRDAPVTTPFDMMINQIVERSRGNGRHGSCGLGFGETLERNLRPAFALTVGQLKDRALPSRLREIRDLWAPERLDGLGLWPLGEDDMALLKDDAIIEHWLEDAAAFLHAVAISDSASLRETKALVFEGAQGLLLDQDRGDFPHVTRSNTGLKNVLALAAEIGLAHLDVYYVTRCYATRHGAGPLSHELSGPPHQNVVDATNIDNPWQGALRFGTLDLSILQSAVASDVADSELATVKVSHSLAMTCLDQVGDAVSYFHAGRLRQASPDALAAAAARAVSALTLVRSFGPTRDTIISGYQERAPVAAVRA